MKKNSLIILFFVFLISCGNKVNKSVPPKNRERTLKNISEKGDELRAYINNHPTYNKDIAFFADMSIFSGYNRFFVYDLKKNSIVKEGLVAHGSGSDNPDPEKLTFSNVEGSYCTSLGKYKVAESYEGDFGKAYKLYGLDASNSKAYDRSIVMHKFSAVPDKEQTSPICLSLGCPMVSPSFFQYLENIIDHSSKNILLYIYKS